MKRIAILFAGDIYNRKGLTNAVLERATRMSSDRDFKVDVFCIMEREGWLVRLLRGRHKRTYGAEELVDGIPIRLLWKPFLLCDYLLLHRLQQKPLVAARWYSRIAHLFQSYDLVIAHSWEAGVIAMEVKKRYGIPYVVTWHGSDIHTFPQTNRFGRGVVRQLLENADKNLFVSKALLETSRSITESGAERIVSYNGVSERFSCYSAARKQELRTQFGVPVEAKVVAFVGNLFPIKNADLLPDIFRSIQQGFDHPLIFWVVGDGKLRESIEKQLAAFESSLSYKMWGNQPAERMPDLMNCMDLLLLPSRNEGMPLVVGEALQSGVSVVASDVGGIKELLEERFVVPLGDGFLKRFSERCCSALQEMDTMRELSSRFRWDRICSQEKKIYESLI